MRLALIGCGNIANYHVPAMRMAGFEIISVAGSENSKRAHEFAQKHDIKNVYRSGNELLNASSTWDALLLTTSISVISDYIHQAAPLGKPILVEKPVALNQESLKELMGYNNIKVAYNRRFYSSTEYSKKFIETHDNILVKASIPESRISPEHDQGYPQRLPFLTYENSVHVFDLLNYLAGDVIWESASVIREINRYMGVVAIGKGSHGITIYLDNYYNSPDNFSINILSNDERVEMKPIEIANYYHGMQVNEPTEETPIRTYVPKLVERVITMGETGIKPGFQEQAQEFMNYCRGAKNGIGAGMKDAYKALDIAHSLLAHCK